VIDYVEKVVAASMSTQEPRKDNVTVEETVSVERGSSLAHNRKPLEPAKERGFEVGCYNFRSGPGCVRKVCKQLVRAQVHARPVLSAEVADDGEPHV
jgi:hypothetical protein